MKRNTHKLSKYEGRHRKDLTRASCYWKFLKEECIMKTYRLRAAWIPVETGTPWSLGFLFSTLAGGVWFWGTFALILHLRTPQQPPCAGLHGVQWRWRPAHRPSQHIPLASAVQRADVKSWSPGEPKRSRARAPGLPRKLLTPALSPVVLTTGGVSRRLVCPSLPASAFLNFIQVAMIMGLPLSRDGNEDHAAL